MNQTKKPLSEDLYKAIVIDRDNKNFKVISGEFHDKQDLSDKYINDYIIRKIYKKEVFDWILKNAKTTLDAYILLSTSYKKWVNKDITKFYYYKIKKDLPVLQYVESHDKLKASVKSLVEKIASEVTTEIDPLNDEEFLKAINEPTYSFVTLTVKNKFGFTIDSVQVEFPSEIGADTESDMYRSEEVTQAVKDLFAKHPKCEFVYYTLPGEKKAKRYIDIPDEI